MVASSYGYWGDYSVSDIRGTGKQIGGGEYAMLSLAREWASMGHEVILFYGSHALGKVNGVDMLPVDQYVSMVCSMDHDVLVSWDAPYLFRFGDRAKRHILAFQLNDAQIGSFDWTIDYYMHPSEWHAARFMGLYPEMSERKVRSCVTNGIDFSRYERAPHIDYDPHRIIYSSSPDRGLHHLLRMWDTIIDMVPDARLDVFYNIDNWVKMIHEIGISGEMMDRANEIEGFKHPAVTFHGGVDQSTLAMYQKASGLLVYPCDPVRPTEGFSMTILEGLTAGCTVITSNADALQELWGSSGAIVLPLPIDYDTWSMVIIDELNKKKSNTLLFNPEFSWEHVAKQWLPLFETSKEI